VCHPAGAPSPQPDRHGRPVRVLPPDQWDTPPADFQVAVWCSALHRRGVWL